MGESEWLRRCSTAGVLEHAELSRLLRLQKGPQVFHISVPWGVCMCTGYAWRKSLKQLLPHTQHQPVLCRIPPQGWVLNTEISPRPCSVSDDSAQHWLQYTAEPQDRTSQTLQWSYIINDRTWFYSYSSQSHTKRIIHSYSNYIILDVY